MQLRVSKPGSIPPALMLALDYLREIVEKLSFTRVFGTPANAKAEGIVADEFRRILGTSFVVGKTRNVCAGNPKTARFLIGAHYDSVPGTPGADDNASAVAVMLAVSQSIGPRAYVLYVAF